MFALWEKSFIAPHDTTLPLFRKRALCHNPARLRSCFARWHVPRLHARGNVVYWYA